MCLVLVMHRYYCYHIFFSSFFLLPSLSLSPSASVERSEVSREGDTKDC